MESIRALLAGIVDYAGLFPPATLDMEGAVRRYAAYRSGQHAWALARFVVPVARLAEFGTAAAGLAPGQGPWRLSAVAGPDVESDLARIVEFNRRVEAVIEAVEIKASGPEQIRMASRAIPSTLEAYFEVPIANPWLEAIREGGARAKVRTGGVTPDLFPSSVELARFLGAGHSAGVAFKASAGLHHAVRSVHPLTYEPDAPAGKMHGFLNVFLAAAFVRAGMEVEEAATLLDEESPEAFRFDAGAAWRDYRLDAASLQSARQSFAGSFGSCSFEEPIQDLQALRLL